MLLAAANIRGSVLVSELYQTPNKYSAKYIEQISLLLKVYEFRDKSNTLDFVDPMV